MATIKSYTDIEQSRNLAKFLPIESADMHYKVNRYNNESKIFMIPYSELGYHKDNDYQYCACAWSLAALLSILPNIKLCHYDDSYFCQYMGIGDEFPMYSTQEYNNSVDACVEMIEKLHKLKML